MNKKSLFFSLFYAQTEEGVKQIIESDSELSKQSNWLPYGGTLGNYSSFENQQSTAEGALMEKVTNSIDAILVRQSLTKGIDPKSQKAPQSMDEAVKTLFSNEELENEKVLVITDGSSQQPNIIIADNGEGQEASDFEDTLLSLQKGNKNSIKFVQGKFNMGSTGAAVFCGKYKYQLIASKRHSSLSGSSALGFTIVRKHVRTPEEEETMKNTWYEYFTLDGVIPEFETEDFHLVDDETDPYFFKEGTIVKLYNYQLSKKSVSYKNLKNDINNHLYFPAFPIYVHEARKDYRAASKRNVTNIGHGNGFILRGGKSKKVDDSLEYKSIDLSLKNPSLYGEAKIDLFVFKEEEKDLAKDYRGSKPIVFLMNGQVQYHLPTSYISSDLGLKLIKNHLVVSIDCTNLNKKFLDEGFFMANRETIRQSENTKRFLQDITDFLKNHKGLEKVNKLRASKKISSSGTKDLMERLLGKGEQDKFLRSLFQQNSLGSNSQYNSHLEKDDSGKELKNFPTYMKIKNAKKDEEGNNVKSVPLDKKIKFSVETNAVDDYFARTNAPGQLEIVVNGFSGSKSSSYSEREKSNIKERFTITQTNLENGELNISMFPSASEVEIGDEFEISLKLIDIHNEFEQILKVKITEPATSTEKKKNPKKEKLTLPTLIQVYKNGEVISKLERDEEEKNNYETWQDRGWDEETGKDKIVEILPGTDNQAVSVIYINMSSPVLNQIITEEGTTGTKVELVQEQFLTYVYMQSFLLTATLSNIQKRLKNISSEALDYTLENIEAENLASDMVKEMAYAFVKMQMNNIKNLSA